MRVLRSDLVLRSQGARSWAEKAFGAASAPDSSFSGQQKLSQTQSDLDSHDRAIRGARDRTASRHVSIKAPMLSDSGSFSRSSDDRALEERNHEDLSMSGESKGFYADAMSELPPAPHLSSLRGTKQPVRYVTCMWHSCLRQGWWSLEDGFSCSEGVSCGMLAITENS